MPYGTHPDQIVDEKKIDAKYKIEINASKLISKQLLTKAQEHEVVLKDKYRISENLNVPILNSNEELKTQNTKLKVIKKYYNSYIKRFITYSFDSPKSYILINEYLKKYK